MGSETESVDQMVWLLAHLRLLFETYPWWMVISMSIGLTFILRWLLVRVFKMVGSFLLFALIYCSVLVGLGFLLI